MEENRREEIEKRIGELRLRLNSNTSDVGDWKVAKCMEAYVSGDIMPYDFEQLKADRQSVRDEINMLQEELIALPAENAGIIPWTEEDEIGVHGNSENSTEGIADIKQEDEPIDKELLEQFLGDGAE